VRPRRRALLGLAVGALLGGCTPFPASGLRPVPPVRAAITGDRILRAADALQPTLRWEAFPRPEDLRADTTGRLAHARNVTYELRIWREADPGALTYARGGMTDPVHTVETPLAPATVYLWTMRARFELDGEPRVIQWGVLDILALPDEPVIPHRGYYRFMTPRR
jgi:hypothetical protein